MVGQREPGVRVGDLDVHLHRRLGGQGLEQLADGGDRGLVTGQEEGGRIAVDGVAAAGTGDRRRVAGPGRLRPLGREPTAVDDDLDIELEGARGRRGAA